MAGKFDFIETDKRILEQKLRRHQISQSEYQKILKSVADEKDVADELKIHSESPLSILEKK